MFKYITSFYQVKRETFHAIRGAIRGSRWLLIRDNIEVSAPAPAGTGAITEAQTSDVGVSAIRPLRLTLKSEESDTINPLLAEEHMQVHRADLYAGKRSTHLLFEAQVFASFRVNNREVNTKTNKSERFESARW